MYVQGKQNFFVDVCCGDGHSLALTCTRDAFAWGNNKDGQLGFDPDQFPRLDLPRKIVLSEYMNSSKQETFSGIKACANYTILIADSKNVIFHFVNFLQVYLSCKSSETPFMPLFGKSAQA